MNVMLVVIFACIGVGIFGDRWAKRETWIITAFATLMVMAYFLHPGFMT